MEIIIKKENVTFTIKGDGKITVQSQSSNDLVDANIKDAITEAGEQIKNLLKEVEGKPHMVKDYITAEPA